MNRRSISGNNTEQVLQSQITNLQSNLVAMRTNLAVGPNALNYLSTGTNNTAVGNTSRGGQYGIMTGSNNVIGAGSGESCENRSNNTFLGTNTALTAGQTLFSDSIALGASAVISNSNQLMVTSNVNLFNMAGLATSTGTGTGTILEFDLAGNVLPTAGTYKTVASIDTVIAAINAPNYFWFTNPTLSGTETTSSSTIYNPIRMLSS